MDTYSWGRHARRRHAGSLRGHARSEASRGHELRGALPWGPLCKLGRGHAWPWRATCSHVLSQCLTNDSAIHTASLSVLACTVKLPTCCAGAQMSLTSPVQKQAHARCCSFCTPCLHKSMPSRTHTSNYPSMHALHTKASADRRRSTWLSRRHLAWGPHDRGGLNLGAGKHHSRGWASYPACWPSQTLHNHSTHLAMTF